MLISGTLKIDRLVSRQDVQGLIKALNNHKDVTVRQAAASALGQMRVTEAVIPLMQLLKGETTPVRQAAALALGQIGDNIALTSLMIALEDDEQEIRQAAARALGQIGDEQAVLPLIRFLAQCAETDQEIAFTALTQIGMRMPSTALRDCFVDPLLTAFKHDMNRGRAAILEHMGWEQDAVSDHDTTLSRRDALLRIIERTGWRADQSATAALYWMFKGEWERCAAIGAPAVSPLVDVLRNRDMDPYTHDHAATALSQIGTAAVEPLIALLQDKEPELRQVALRILVQVGRPAVEPLIATLEDETPEMRRSVIEMLGSIGDKRAIHSLVLAFKDSNWGVRQAATTALSNIGKPAIDALITMLRDTEDNVNWLAAEALDKMGWTPDQTDIGASYWIAKNEWGKCEEIGAPAISPLIGSLGHWNDDIRKLAAETLGKLGEMTMEPLCLALKDKNPDVREAVVLALGEIGDSRAIKPLTTSLRDAQMGVRRAAINVLIRMGAKEDTLIMALRNDEAIVRKLAARELGRIGSSHAIQPLINLLEDTNNDVSQAAFWSLGQIGDTSAIEPLIMALTLHAGNEHEAMVAALGRIGSKLPADALQPHLVEPLLNAFQNEAGLIRDLVIELLEELEWQPGQDATATAYWMMKDQWSRCVEIGTPAIPALIEALRSNDTHIRQNASWALSQLGRDAVEPLMPLLQDEDSEVSLVAYSTLVKIGRPAIEPLIMILQREGAGVHQAAAEVLGLIGESHVVDPLIEALRDPNPLGREAATEALIKIGKPARDALIQVLCQESDEVRAHAARALEQIGWQPDRSEIGAIYWITKRRWDRCAQMGELAINPLIDILKDDDSEVRSIGVTALVRIGQPTLEPLIAALQHPHPNVRSSVAWALARLRDDRALEPIIATLRDTHIQVREAAMKALGLIGDERVVEPLIDAIKHGEEEDRERGFAALAQIGVRMRGKQFEKNLVEPVINTFQDEPVSLREAASAMLENMGWQPGQNATGAIYWIMRGRLSQCVEIGSAAIEPLLYTLRAKDIQTRQNAFWALVKIGEPVIPPLIALLDDSDTEMRQAAFWALVKIGRPAIEALIESLQHESAMVRRAAIEILGRIGDERAINPLFAMLEESDLDIREAAVVALESMGKSARGMLTNMLQNSQQPVQKRAADTLERIGWRPNENEHGAVYWITRHNWHKCVQIGAPAVQPLIEALHSSTSEVHKSIIWALAHIGYDAVEPLIATLQDDDANVRGVAAVTLGRIGDVRALQPLIKALDDGDPRVERAAAWAVQPIGIAALQESDREVYTTAARVLGRVGDTQAVQPLINALKEWDDHDHEVAFSALVQIGERMESANIQAGLIEPLVAAFQGEQRSRHTSVTGLITQMGLQPDRSAVGAAYAIMQGAWERCVEIGETAIPALIEALRTTDEHMRQNAAETLAKLDWQPGHDETAAMYWSMLQEWERCVEIGAPAIQPLISRLNHTDEEVRAAVIDALVRIGTAANERLITALNAPDVTVREGAATTLGRIGDVEVIQPLIKTIKRCRGECCEAIFSALAQIGLHLHGTILQVWLVEPLIEAFKDEDASRWQRVNTLIEEVGWKPGQSEASATYWILQGEWERCIEAGPFAIAPLIAAMQRSDQATRLQAAHMLERLGWTPDQSEQGAIYWIALGKWSRCVEIGAAAVQPLLAALRYQDKAGREAIVDALVRIGLPAVQPLIVALRAGQPYVREVAAITLGLLGDTQAVEPLIKILRDEHEEVRGAAVKSLAVLGDVRAMKPLMSLLRDNHETVRVAAAEAVGVKMWGRGRSGQTTQLVPNRA